VRAESTECATPSTLPLAEYWNWFGTVGSAHPRMGRTALGRLVGVAMMSAARAGPWDYPAIPCTQDQPDGVPYCNTNPEDPECTCGTCDQHRQEATGLPSSGVSNTYDTYSSFVTDPALNSAPSGACGNLCGADYTLPTSSAEMRAARSSNCRFPATPPTWAEVTGGAHCDSSPCGEAGVCKQYTCKHKTAGECAALAPMFAFMNPGQAPPDWFRCETLLCEACPAGWEVSFPLGVPAGALLFVRH
jgi:hypothetical protein